MNEISSIKCSCWWAGKTLSVVELRESILIKHKARLIRDDEQQFEMGGCRPHCCWSDVNVFYDGAVNGYGVLLDVSRGYYGTLAS